MSKKKKVKLCVSIRNKQSGLQAVYLTDYSILPKLVDSDAHIRPASKRHLVVYTKTIKTFYRLTSIVSKKCIKELSRNFKNVFTYGFGELGWY